MSVTWIPTTSPADDEPATTRTATLLLGDTLSGHGSLAPGDVRRRSPLLLGGASGHGSLAPADHRRPAVARREAPEKLLENALADHVAGLGRHQLKHRRLRAVIDRLGLAGRPPLTLAEAGRIAGLSGERVRQLEVRLRKQQLAMGEARVPQLDAALDVVARALPVPASGVARLLLEAGLTATAFSAESLRCAAELLGQDVPFVFSGSGRATVLLPQATAATMAQAPAIEARARRQAERCGASTLEDLERELVEGDGLQVTRRQLRVVLETCGMVECLQQGWFTFRDARSSGPFVKTSLRMLAVSPALSVESLRDGLRRQNSFRRLPPPPPVAVLTEIYRCHPSFRLHGDIVAAAQPVDPILMGPLNERMVQILRAAPGGVLPRAQLLASCHDAGLNLTSVNLYTTYSECVERVGPGLFAARGAVVPAHARAVVKRRPADRAEAVHGHLPDTRPWLSWRVTPGMWANGVVHVPAELRPVLEGQRFSCLDADGTQLATVGIDCHGNSWGWTGFLRRAGAQLGDVVRAVFDPVGATAVLEVIDAADPTG